MEFRLLGPLEVVVGGRSLEVGAPRQRLVLAVVAAEAGRPVSVETLIDRVWEEAPEGARRTLYVYVSRIRRVLATASVPGQPPVALVRRSGGYLLDLDPDRVDVHRFQRLVGRARQRECPEAERVALLGQALQLWRGQPLSGLPGRWAARVGQGWQQQYLETVVAWAAACLHVGDPDTVLPRLRELVGEHPLMESLAAVYLRALCAAGRPADALEHYATVRRRLAEQLGIDPGTELQRLHRQILSADPALAPPATATSGSPLVPRQLPAPPQMFTGRAYELAALSRIHESSTVVVTVIDGMAGIGKTALALHAAHRIADRYPDGQLFVDLHGYTHGTQPIEPAEALDQLLRALGIPGTLIPHGLEQRAALYRTRLAGQRVLVVLDNAATEAQVTPLLPGGPGCLVLVTSRRRLAGLDHTYTLSLDTLPADDAVRVFALTAGEGRLAGQSPELVAELVELCGRLPLAIRIAAARLRSHPSWSVAHLVERLRDRQHRLSELAAGQRSITAALDVSYQHLSPDQQHIYRLLGLHPGLDIDTHATAALLDSTLLHASRMLDQLLEAHLLLEPEAGRYQFHDLIRAHAATIAARDLAEAARSAAVDRLLGYYRHTASVAMDAAYPYEQQRRPKVPSARTPTPEVSDPAAALDWLDTELPNLLAAARYAYGRGRPTHLVHTSMILHRHLYTRGRYCDAATVHEQAMAAARATGDRTGQLAALTGLGETCWLQGRYEQAIDHFEQALQLARDIGDRAGEPATLTAAGEVHFLQGRFAEAADDYQQTLRLARAARDRAGELNALAWLGQPDDQARAHDGLAHAYRALHEIERAREHWHHALDILTSLGIDDTDASPPAGQQPVQGGFGGGEHRDVPVARAHP